MPATTARSSSRTSPTPSRSGTLYVSAYGGGTCNTEFEFLTGNSMSYLGSGVYPYTIYDLLDTKNLAEQFKDLGYTTTAMHPNHGTNWNRENVYSGFGFDRFMTINDFQDAEKLRGMVSDAATYDKIHRDARVRLRASVHLRRDHAEPLRL